MPRGPKGQKRPADVIGNAVHVMRIATGQIANELPSDKDPHAVALGKRGGAKGGKARAAKLTHDQRREAARKAAKARWSKKRS